MREFHLLRIKGVQGLWCIQTLCVCTEDELFPFLCILGCDLLSTWLPHMSPPQHADELLYDPDCCSCGLEWRCIPHDACFIHDSCLCEGSGSFPPIKPQRPSWAQYSYDWYCELAASLSLHPHSPLPRFGSEVEPNVMFFGLSDPPS